jgi:serine/threonine-protein kinase HipA
LDTKQQENIFKKMEKARGKWMECIDNSFMTDKYKMAYKELINNRFERISKLKWSKETE